MKQELITIDKNNLNRLQDITYLLQMCLSEFEKEVKRISLAKENINTNKEDIKEYNINPLFSDVVSFKKLLYSFSDREKEMLNEETLAVAVPAVKSSYDEKTSISITTFLKNKKELIHSLYKFDKSDKNAHYYFVLKNDTFETRNELFDCLEEYEESELLHSNTLSHFHFISNDMASKLKQVKKIDID